MNNPKSEIRNPKAMADLNRSRRWGVGTWRVAVRIERWMALSAVVTTLLGTLPLSAAKHAIDWYTIDSGGGISADALFQLSGTIGQSDTSVVSGGQFSVSGGYWPGAVVPAPCDCELEFRRIGLDLIITWPECCVNCRLFSTDKLGEEAVWVEISLPPGAHSYATPVVDLPQQFYQLVCPAE